jgi:GxxExxY protein
MTENDLSYIIRGKIFDVYKELGPGLLESVYQAALLFDLQSEGLAVEAEVPVKALYKGQELGIGYRIDLLVDKKVLIEIKSVDSLLEVHHKQVLTYLRLTGIKLGILVNFSTDDIRSAIFRKVNKL